MIAALFLTLAAPALTVTQLLMLHRARFDRAAKFRMRREVLGTHRGQRVVAEYICADLCPANTARVIHYDRPADAGCGRAGGQVVTRMVPHGIGIGSRLYCVPPVLARLR